MDGGGNARGEIGVAGEKEEGGAVGEEGQIDERDGLAARDAETAQAQEHIAGQQERRAEETVEKDGEVGHGLGILGHLAANGEREGGDEAVAYGGDDGGKRAFPLAAGAGSSDSGKHGMLCWIYALRMKRPVSARRTRRCRRG